MLPLGFVLATSAVFLGGISCIFLCVKGNNVLLRKYVFPILLSTVVIALILESLMQSNYIYSYDTYDYAQVVANESYQVNNDVVHSDPNFMHFIKTRFMQKQHKLIILGKARLELFETFCLPSMINQTRKDFIWYILADPDLSDEILIPMKKLLAPYSNRFFLLLQNSHTSPRALDFDNVTVASGNVDVLRQAILDSQQKIVLETRLDADDGLNVNFVERIRNDVNTIFEDDGWRNYYRIFCPRRILNWYFGDLTSSMTQSNETSESNRIMSSPDGYLEDDAKSTQKLCITPGLTFVLPPNVRGTGMGHHFIRRKVRSCSTGRYENCRQDYTDDWFQALRARTPTSTGMGGVYLTVDGMKFGGSELWNRAINDFNVQKSRVQTVRQYFDVHMSEIAQENLEGQCIKGFPCKGSTQNNLRRIVGTNSSVESNSQSTNADPNFMHFIKTRFMQQQPNLITLEKARIALFVTFCLPSMINQSQKDFIWYIEVDPNLSDALLVLMKKLLSPYSDRFFLLSQNSHTSPRDLDLDKISVISGNVDILRQAILDSQQKIVLETRLNADDGLNINFIKNLRKKVKTVYRSRRMKRRNYWRIFCPRRLLNWYSSDLTSSMANSNETNGDNRIMSSPVGYLEDDGKSTEKLCITPGLTFVLPPNIEAPSVAQDQIRIKVKQCSTGKYENCRQDFTDDWFQGLRTRTPSSAGMFGSTSDIQDMKFGGSELWNSAVIDFTIQKSRVQSVRQYFDAYLAEIAQ